MKLFTIYLLLSGLFLPALIFVDYRIIKQNKNLSCELSVTQDELSEVKKEQLQMLLDLSKENEGGESNAEST